MSSPQSKARVVGLMRPMKDVTVTAGETATFDCELSYEGIAVEWFLGGTKLEPSDRVSSTFILLQACGARSVIIGILTCGFRNNYDSFSFFIKSVIMLIVFSFN